MIALDLDNTIICYDAAFRHVAVQMGCEVPTAEFPNKAVVKACALHSGGNTFWTRIQGAVYGEGLQWATLYPGCREFISTACRLDIPVIVVSHKTEYPVLGEKVNLRRAARLWLLQQLPELEDPAIHFCDTREAKLERLASLEATAVLDDLPEVFLADNFPAGIRFVLFDPAGAHKNWSTTPRVTSWSEAERMLLP